jgi:rhodanese-related sulfurtransferase
MGPLSPWAMSGIFLVALTAVLGLWFLWIHRAPTPMDATTARAAIHDKTIHAVVDVRDETEWSAGHLSNAIHIHGRDIPTVLPRRIPDRSTSILFYCRTGRRAAAAARTAQALGYSNVYYLDDSDYTGLIHRSKILTA